MLNMKTRSLLCGLFALQLAGAASAALITESWAVGTDIPEGNPVGVAFSQALSGQPAGPISSVAVDLNISGGYNGGLFAYLTWQGANGNTAMEVLLNQVGTSAANPPGYSDTGFNVTLSDAGTANLHSYQNYGPSFNSSGQLLGTWQPDSANTLNGTFGGLTANGTWTLYLADLMGGGGTSTLESWGLEISVAASPVPEGGTGYCAWLALPLVLGAHAWRGRKTLRWVRARA
jgi:hypothetical protein